MRLSRPSSRKVRGFTLAEVLAALAFMAIVIPVAIEGLRLANAAGQLGQRRVVAAQVAERMLNELIINSQGDGSTQNGVILENNQEYRWSARWETWPEDSMRQLSIQVIFSLQGRDYDVQLTTLLDNTSTS
jgi:type II secretion system protein I